MRSFCWIRERVIAAGVKHLIAINLSHPDVAPAVAVRVIIPGLESNNPFYTGPRARLALIEDLLNSEVM